jgi:hypothetical protein
LPLVSLVFLFAIPTAWYVENSNAGILWKDFLGGNIPMRMFSFQRSRTGQVALSLNIVLSIFVVGSLGLMCYEVSRILLAREQLRHCLELTALGGGVAMASTSQSGTLAQTEAKTVASQHA